MGVSPPTGLCVGGRETGGEGDGAKGLGRRKEGKGVSGRGKSMYKGLELRVECALRIAESGAEWRRRPCKLFQECWLCSAGHEEPGKDFKGAVPTCR